MKQSTTVAVFLVLTVVVRVSLANRPFRDLDELRRWCRDNGENYDDLEKKKVRDGYYISHGGVHWYDRNG